MRAAVLALILAACSPPAPAPPAPETEVRVEMAPDSIRVSDLYDDDRVALAGALTPGAWNYLGDDRNVSACFSAGGACIVTIHCEQLTGIITVRYAHELSPDQSFGFRILVASHLIDLPGRSSNAGVPFVETRLADGTFERQILIDALTPVQERFAFDIWHEVQVFPWHESVARTLEECQ
jgi:hypothetical protein